MSTERIDVEALRGHTPGPWSICDVPLNECWFAGVTIGAAAGVRVADTCVLNAHHDVDGKLIAAAPALLAEVIERRARDAAVAELVAASIDNVSDGCPCDGCERVRAALVAIQGSQP